MRSVWILWALCAVLAGCQAQGVKPGADSPENAEQGADGPSQTQPATASEQTASAQPEQEAPKAPQANDLLLESSRQVEQRITLMQEQVIKLNEQMTSVQQRNMQLLQAIQRLQLMLTQQQPAQAADTEAEPVVAVDDRDAPEAGQLQASLQRLEQQLRNSGPMAAGFKLASAYTPKGQWVIFKYDEATGLTWKAQDGGWDEIGELESLPLSRYQVVLRPAAGDVKGYVAARVDRETGRSWWLKGNTWESFQ